MRYKVIYDASAGRIEGEGDSWPEAFRVLVDRNLQRGSSHTILSIGQSRKLRFYQMPEPDWEEVITP